MESWYIRRSLPAPKVADTLSPNSREFCDLSDTTLLPFAVLKVTSLPNCTSFENVETPLAVISLV